MRPLEVAGLLFAIVPALALLDVAPAIAGVVGTLCAVIVFIISAFLLGTYWQLIPLYLAVVLAAAVFSSRRNHPQWRRRLMAAAIACLLFLTAAFTYVLPIFSLPQPTGSYAVGTRTIHLVDPVRMETHISGSTHPREMMVQVWYPAEATSRHLAAYRTHKETTLLSSYMDALWTHSHPNAPVASDGAPFPVLLFNPAWAGQRTQNTYQMEDLASHGFVVVGIDHTYNSGPTAFPDGRVLHTLDPHDIADFQQTTVDEQLAIGDKEVRVEAGDDILVLNFLAAAAEDPASPWFHRVDANNAGAFGHSFGGAVAAQTCYDDPRVKAALNEDGWMFGDVRSSGLRKPYMALSGDDAPITATQLHSTDLQTSREAEFSQEDDQHLATTLHRYGGYLITIPGTRHNNFRDRALYSPLRRLTEAGPISPRRAHQIVEEYTLQFFSSTLKQQTSPLLSSATSPYKEVRFENYSLQHAPIQ